jgi:hypothetical protein
MIVSAAFLCRYFPNAMTEETSTPHGRLHLAGLVILVAGLLAAVLVFVIAAGDAGADAAGYTIVGGKTFAIGPGDSSRELQQIERLGGKAAVLTYQFQTWFASLWHGQRLAFTLAVLSIAVALACFHIADLMAEDVDE